MTLFAILAFVWALGFLATAYVYSRCVPYYKRNRLSNDYYAWMPMEAVALFWPASLPCVAVVWCIKLVVRLCHWIEPK